jgi:hypothetical protein
MKVRPASSHGTIVFAALILALAIGAAPDSVLAEGPDWLIGVWVGESPSPSGTGTDSRELKFEAAGKLSGFVHSARGGFIDTAGTYTVEGDTVKLDGTYTNGPRAVLGQKFSMSLSKTDKGLEGTVYSSVSGKSTPISLTKK